MGGDDGAQQPAKGRKVNGDLDGLDQRLGITARDRRSRLRQIEREEAVRPLVQVGIGAVLGDEIAIASLNALVVLSDAPAVQE